MKYLIIVFLLIGCAQQKAPKQLRTYTDYGVVIEKQYYPRTSDFMQSYSAKWVCLIRERSGMLFDSWESDLSSDKCKALYSKVKIGDSVLITYKEDAFGGFDIIAIN